MRLEGKVCLITGGGKGIGAATALEFVKEGAFVEIGDIDALASAQVAAEIQRQYGTGRVWTTEVDVTDFQSVERFVRQIQERHGKIDVLFNNAGVSAVGPLHKVSEDLWNKVIAVNLTGVYHVSKAVIPIMLKQQSGSIINMSSCIAEIGLLDRAAYAATKGAVLSMTKSMQVDYASSGIRVNALLPGTIYTPFVEDYLKNFYENQEEAISQLKSRQLGNALGTPKDVALAATYLASDESAYVLGSGLVVDGGVTAGKKN